MGVDTDGVPLTTPPLSFSSSSSPPFTLPSLRDAKLGRHTQLTYLQDGMTQQDRTWNMNWMIQQVNTHNNIYTKQQYNVALNYFIIVPIIQCLLFCSSFFSLSLYICMYVCVCVSIVGVLSFETE